MYSSQNIYTKNNIKYVLFINKLFYNLYFIMVKIRTIDFEKLNFIMLN